MKKKVKWALWALATVALAAVAVVSMFKPLVVDVYTVAPKRAESYFIEQGFVKAADEMSVYPVAGGKVLSVHVAENDPVRKGDVLCVLDDAAMLAEKAQLQSGISGYRAQIQNLTLEEQRQRDSLKLNKDSLQGEYQALIAQESQSAMSKGEQLRLQNILVEQSRNELEAAQSDMERAALLWENSIISQKEYTAAQQAVAAAQARLNSAIQQLTLIEKGGDQGNSADYYNAMKAALEQQMQSLDAAMAKSYTAGMQNYYNTLIESNQASISLIEKQLADTTVTAPIDGMITSLPVKNSNMASPQTPIAVITGPSSQLIEVFIPTKDRDSVQEGDQVRLVAKRQQGDVTFEGTVDFIDSQATVKLSSMGLEERKVKVRILPELTENAVTLDTGFDVDVWFFTYQADNQLTVPKTAVFKDESGQDCLWLVVGGKAVQTPVTLGQTLRTEYVVESGVSADDVVIVDANVQGLSEGQRVAAGE